METTLKTLTVSTALLQKIVRDEAGIVTVTAGEKSEFVGWKSRYTGRVTHGQIFYDKTYVVGSDTWLFAVAHEYGHWLDYKERTWAYYAPYHYATPMSRMDVEMRAWDFALRVLTELGFTDWEAFDARRVYALETHNRCLTEVYEIGKEHF